VHHRTIQINHQPDATVFQFIILKCVYSSTRFGHFPAHHQELSNCSGSLWFYLRIVVTVVLCLWWGRPAGPTTNTARLLFALVQTKQIRINIHKRNNTKHTTNNTKHNKYKYTYYPNIHTYTHPHITQQVQITTVQDTPKLNSHNTIKYPQYKVTPMYMTLLSPRTLP
jgi:hypothetical protein